MDAITLGDGAIIGAFVALAMLLYRLIDYLLNKKLNMGECKADRCVKDTQELHDAAKEINEVDLKQMASQIQQLYTWHNKTDRDGVPVWYVRSSLEEAINRLVQAIETQTQLLQRLEMQQELGEKNKKKD